MDKPGDGDEAGNNIMESEESDDDIASKGPDEDDSATPLTTLWKRLSLADLLPLLR